MFVTRSIAINDQCWTSIEDRENLKPALPSTDGFFRSGKTGSLYILRYTFEGDIELSVCYIISVTVATTIPVDSQEKKIAIRVSVAKRRPGKEQTP